MESGYFLDCILDEFDSSLSYIYDFKMCVKRVPLQILIKVVVCYTFRLCFIVSIWKNLNNLYLTIEMPEAGFPNQFL